MYITFRVFPFWKGWVKKECILDIEFGVLKREDLKEAVEMSVRAYEDYAYFANYFPDTTERLKMLWAVMYRGWLTYFKQARFLTARIDGKIVGLAELEPPHFERPSVFQFLIHGWLQVYLDVNFKRMQTWLAMDESAGKPCHDYKKSGPDIWYVGSLTVDPPLQGKGIGTRLLDFAGDYVRERGGKQLTLFTNSEKNIAFYTKCGFETFHKYEIAHDGKTMGSWSVKKSV